MEECEHCGKWTSVYYPQAEEYRCSSCGHVKKMPYEEYLALKNVVHLLKYPQPEAKT